MIVDAHLDIAWNAVSAGRGFLGTPAPGYLVSRSSLITNGVGLVFATLYTAPARAGRSMPENALTRLPVANCSVCLSR